MFKRSTILAVAALILPILIWFTRDSVEGERDVLPVISDGTRYPASPLPMQRQVIGPLPKFHPKITNVQITDLDRDGTADVIACDAQYDRVCWYRQTAMGGWEERIIGTDVGVPAHATVVDLDGDGDLDVIVSALGSYWPSDEHIGKIVLLEQGPEGFTPKVLLADVRRVADVQPGDFDADGDLDLAVAVFGYSRGQVLWLENLGDTQFLERELLAGPGIIHVPVADYDNDGDLDIAAVVSQEEEEIWVLNNLGGGSFEPIMLYATPNYDIGSAGLVAVDLDRDGDTDLLWPVGDNLEDRYLFPQPYHGCYWLENQGDWKFQPQRIGDLGGTYAAGAGDLDADGDTDVVLVSMCNDWRHPGNASVAWLENDGQQNFTPWQIDNQPTHLITVAVGDINADGRDDVIAGGMHVFEPYDRVGRITAWLSNDGSDQ